MEFGSNCNNKDGFCEEEEDHHQHQHHHHHQVNICNNGEMDILSSSCFSSSSSSPSSHYRSHVVHQQQPLTDHQQQKQQQQQHWGSSSQSYHNHHHPIDSSVNRFHGGGGGGGGGGGSSSTTTTYEGFNNNFSHQRHEFMDLSPRSNENMERDVGNIGSSSGNNEVICIEREHMFDKVVTPSDVGKLNRLVIPKQHAEKYFPLDSTANEKGLLLSFEDRSGKPWRFRYSYWNSSQSYVMTKGWSRFVKEKKLDAGDIVTFERGASELMKDRLFIDWRRRPNAPDHHHHHHLGSLPSHLSFHNPLSFPRTVPWGRFFLPQTMSHQSGSMPSREHLHLQQQLNYYDHQQQQHNHHLQRQSSSSTTGGSTTTGYGYNMVNPSHPGAVYYLRSSSAAPQQAHGLVQQAGVGDVPMVFDSVPVVQGKAAAKRVRLFGVNLECPIPDEDVHDSTMAPLTLSPQQLPPHPHPLPPPHPHLQLRVYNGSPLPPMPTELPKRGRSSSLSFDLDI